jgi:hypothetical protein
MTSKRILEEVTDIPVLSISKRLQSFHRLLDANELELIPQISGTCWFNSILTVILYSQMVRNVLYKEVFNWFRNLEELKANRFKRFLIFMLNHNYTNPKKIEELFEGRIKPELLLLSFTNYYNFLEIKKVLKKQISKSLNTFGYTTNTICDIMQAFFTNQRDVIKIIHFQNHSLIKKEDFESFSPKVIILHHELFDNLSDFSIFTEKYIQIDEHISGVATYEEQISVYGRTYKLDACIIENYSSGLEEGCLHSICGITYNNQGYVYNGWINENEHLNFDLYTQFKQKSNCRLFFRDWKSDLRKTENTAGFCLPKNATNCTNLLPLNPRDLCFDFSIKTKSAKVLFYVLVEDELSKQQTQVSISSIEFKSLISIKNLVYKSSSVSPLIREFYNLNEKSNSELEDLLVKIYGENLKLLLIEPELFKVWYLIITKQRLTDNLLASNKDDILRNIFIALIKVYIKNNIVFRLPLLYDIVIYQYIAENQLVDLLIKNGYSKKEIKQISKTYYNSHFILFYLIAKEVNKGNLLSEITSKLFIFNLIKFFINNGIVIDLFNYTDDIIIAKLQELSLEELKTHINFSKEKTQINSIIKNAHRREIFINSNPYIKEINKRLKNRGIEGVKGILILIVISQMTMSELLFDLISSSSRGGFFNYNNDNHKKVRKQLKIY